MSANAIQLPTAPERVPREPEAPPEASRESRPTRRQHSAGWKIALLFVLASVIVTSVGGASVVQYLEPAGAILIGIRLLSARRDADYFEFTLWLWIVTPELRRYVDYHSTYRSVSGVLVAPYLVALASLPFAMRRRRHALWSVRTLFTLLFVAIGYSTIVGLALAGSKTAVVASVLTWLPPVAIGFFVMMTPTPWHELATVMRRFVPSSLLLMAAYGIVQWLVVPAWDTSWLQNIGTAGQSFGQPHPLQLRIWSWLNSPGTFAGTVVWLVVAQLGMGFSRGRAARLSEIAAVVIGTVALGITGVRAGWIALALSLVALLWYGRLPIGRILLGAAVVALAVMAVGGPVGSLIASRASTLTAGTKDTSANARLSFQVRALPQALGDPVGAGIGSTGAGVRAGSSTSNDPFANTDSGYLDILRTFGSVAGGIILVLLVSACCGTFAWARRGRGLTLGLGAITVTMPILLLFGSVWGLPLFLSLGGIARADAVT